jgi:hypothetical protein
MGSEVGRWADRESEDEVPTKQRSLVRLMVGVGLIAALLTGAAGCGGDDDDDAASDDSGQSGGDDGSTTTADPAADSAAYCDAELALETAGDPDVDFETMTPEQQAEAVKTFATETLRPLVDDLGPTVPAELEQQFTALDGAVTQLETTGDPAAFASPEVVAASAAAHAYDLDNCDWTSQAVTTTEYRFAGIADSLDAGVTSFDLTNDGAEVHEMVLLRKNDGVTETADEILALPQEEGLQKAAIMGTAGPVPTGQTAYLVADLDAGDYIAVCFIPVGTTSLDAAPPDGPPHFTQGMVTEFSVS